MVFLELAGAVFLGEQEGNMSGEARMQVARCMNLR
jgi:hypothetical protein